MLLSLSSPWHRKLFIQLDLMWNGWDERDHWKVLSRQQKHRFVNCSLTVLERFQRQNSISVPLGQVSHVHSFGNSKEDSCRARGLHCEEKIITGIHLYSPSFPLEPLRFSLTQNPLPSPPHLFSLVQYLTSASAPIISSSLYKFAISIFNGLSGLGSVNSCCIADNVLESVYMGDQCSVVSSVRQISPVLKWTFGWQIGVTNSILGGEMGYFGGMVMLRSQRPPS